MSAETLLHAWTAILALAVFMYVLLDGFDLGVGLLYPLAGTTEARAAMMASVAPVWDGNETWLVMGGVGLLAAFPVAFAIVIPALYVPVLVMLLGLIFRGVAFEFRLKAARPFMRTAWSAAFFGGSLAATLAQGVMLGAYINGFEVRDGRFAGSVSDWLAPFPLLTGVGLVAGYAMLGATWLVLKTDGDLQRQARGWARWAVVGTALFIALISAVTPWLHDDVRARWFDGTQWMRLAPLPLFTAACGALLWVWAGRQQRELAPFLLALGVFAGCYAGLGVSLYPYVVPHAVTLAEAASSPASQRFLLVGTLVLLPIILGYTAWTYWVFRGKVHADSGYGH